ncbi:putative SPEF1 family protein [Blattamonas nauphoetae]|uniref:SPEF1 family protein n=1 Tax=Blattamonas nauphoetae TaxID=2049346 RepID=A0ABQ9YFC9_9EUKA|nr:putative SPEF1 family protein [Blattamonas nauphoetae]
MSHSKTRQLSDNELNSVYEWIDQFSLSRPKRNISRDFSDGVQMAEICKTCFPGLVDLHNYPSCTGRDKKIYNWQTLNNKVFSKIGLPLSEEQIAGVACATPGAIEEIILLFNQQIENCTDDRGHRSRVEPLVVPEDDDSDFSDHQEETLGQTSEPLNQTSNSRQKSLAPSKANKPPPSPKKTQATRSISEQEVKLLDLERENEQLRESQKIMQERLQVLEKLTQEQEQTINELQAQPKKKPASKKK